MARAAKSTDVGFFHFSFLDILACTVGVLVFMIAIIILHTLGMSAPLPLRSELSKLSLDLTELNKQLEQMRADEERLRKLREALEALASLREQSALKSRLEADIADLAAHIQELEIAEVSQSDELSKLRAIVPRDFKPPKHKIKLATPVQKDSKKRPVFFECDNDGVNPFFGRYIRKYYVTRGIGDGSVIVRRRPGETLEQTRQKSSDWMVEIGRIDPKSQYVAFIVRPSGFGVFLELRERLGEMGIDIGWEPVETGAVNMVTDSSAGESRFLLQ